MEFKRGFGVGDSRLLTHSLFRLFFRGASWRPWRLGGSISFEDEDEDEDEPSTFPPLFMRTPVASRLWRLKCALDRGGWLPYSITVHNGTDQ